MDTTSAKSDDIALTLRLPREIHRKLRRQAFEQETTLTALIREAISRSYEAPTGLGCDVCDKPHTYVSTPGGFRFCDDHRSKWATR